MQETMCTRYGKTQERKGHTCKLDARTTEQGTLRREGICARDNVQKVKEHCGGIEHVQETMCRRTGKFNSDKACARDNVKVTREH